MPRRKTLQGVRPHTRKVAEEILSKWTIYYLWGNGPDGHHAAGRAIDFMTLTQDQQAYRDKVGHEIAAYLQENAKRLGVLYIIFKQRIWNASRPDDHSSKNWSEWRRMEDRGNPTDNHMDHVHVSFYNNPPAYRPPEDDDMPITDADATKIARRFLNLDEVPSGHDENKFWTTKTMLSNTEKDIDTANRRLSKVLAQLGAMQGTVDELVKVVAAGNKINGDMFVKVVREASEAGARAALAEGTVDVEVTIRDDTDQS